MTIYDYDNDFAHYELDEKERSKLGQVWTPYRTIVYMMDKVDSSHWKDETNNGTISDTIARSLDESLPCLKSTPRDS